MAETILILEDDKRTCNLFDTILRRAGYTCFTAADNDQAFKILSEVVPDLILLDIGLPRSSGFVLVQAIKEDPRLSGIKILAVSALTDLADTAEAYELEGFLSKPISSTVLLEAVVSVLEA